MRSSRPLYVRVLRLRHIRPGPMLCFLYSEGAFAVGVLLALAEFIPWWMVPVLVAVVAAMVKLNDMVAGAAQSAMASRPADLNRNPVAHPAGGAAAGKSGEAPAASGTPSGGEPDGPGRSADRSDVTSDPGAPADAGARDTAAGTSATVPEDSARDGSGTGSGVGRVVREDSSDSEAGSGTDVTTGAGDSGNNGAGDTADDTAATPPARSAADPAADPRDSTARPADGGGADTEDARTTVPAARASTGDTVVSERVDGHGDGTHVSVTEPGPGSAEADGSAPGDETAERSSAGTDSHDVRPQAGDTSEEPDPAEAKPPLLDVPREAVAVSPSDIGPDDTAAGTAEEKGREVDDGGADAVKPGPAGDPAVSDAYDDVARATADVPKQPAPRAGADRDERIARSTADEANAAEDDTEHGTEHGTEDNASPPAPGTGKPYRRRADDDTAELPVVAGPADDGGDQSVPPQPPPATRPVTGTQPAPGTPPESVTRPVATRELVNELIRSMRSGRTRNRDAEPATEERAPRHSDPKMPAAPSSAEPDPVTSSQDEATPGSAVQAPPTGGPDDEARSSIRSQPTVPLRGSADEAAADRAAADEAAPDEVAADEAAAADITNRTSDAVARTSRESPTAPEWPSRPASWRGRPETVPRTGAATEPQGDGIRAVSGGTPAVADPPLEGRSGVRPAPRTGGTSGGRHTPAADAGDAGRRAAEPPVVPRRRPVGPLISRAQRRAAARRAARYESPVGRVGGEQDGTPRSHPSPPTDLDVTRELPAVGAVTGGRRDRAGAEPSGAAADPDTRSATSAAERARDHAVPGDDERQQDVERPSPAADRAADRAAEGAVEDAADRTVERGVEDDAGHDAAGLSAPSPMRREPAVAGPEARKSAAQRTAAQEQPVTGRGRTTPRRVRSITMPVIRPAVPDWDQLARMGARVPADAGRSTGTGDPEAAEAGLGRGSGGPDLRRGERRSTADDNPTNAPS